MKIKAKRLAIVLSLMIAVCSIMPLQAQTDGFFRGGDDNYENRSISINSDTENGITNNGIGQSEPTPLGSGLLIMMAAGAGYVMVRRKRVRKGMTMILALALILGMTQCKKKIETVSETSSGLYITLEVDNDSKVIVDPYGHVEPNYSYATVTYETNDTIYVGHNGRFVGKLIYSNNTFSGVIDDSDLSTNDYFHFYFLGNKPLKATNVGGNIVYNLDIVDQSAKYPVISYAHSTDKFNPYVSSYNAHLLNKCSIVKFTTNIDITDNISISGMNNMVIVDFTKNIGGGSANPYSYMMDENNNGEIILHSVSATEKWAILLPQAAVTAATANAPGYVSTTSFGVPTISTNQYLGDGIDITMEEVVEEKGISVSPTKQAVFANGNLKATKTNTEDSWESWTWSFMENPWDAVEQSDSDMATYYAGKSNIGLFGCNPKTHPFYTELDDNYSGRFTTWTSNEITNDPDANNYTWYVPTQAEWAYIFSGRENATSKFGMALVAGKPGVILLPDDCAGVSGFKPYFSTQAYASNTIDESDWTSKYASVGAVFIPANGYRYITYLAEYNIWGGYWTGTTDIGGNGYYMRFVDAASTSFTTVHVEYDPINNDDRYYGGALRLIRYVE